jgi:predicted ATPase/DNA-binding CsgD family transcriptional regulator
MHEMSSLGDGAVLPPALRSVRPRSNLPAPTSRLVGRAGECATLVALLHDPATRLVSLTGIGGVGKTRLALEVAGLLADTVEPFTHGVFLVTLDATLPSESLDEAFAATIASVLGLTLSGPEPPLGQVLAYLRERRILLLLDGEPLRPAAVLIARLLTGAPGLTILVATRERLGIAGELVRPLSGLPCPPDDSPRADDADDAVTLFGELAQRLNPALTLKPEVERAIRRICRLVDGLPLAIELAAGWTGVLTCDEISAELAQGLDLLTSDRPGLPLRHQSLRAAFQTSWELLSPAERRTLRRLAVFQCAFDREEAAALLGDVRGEGSTRSPLLAILASLVDKSLLQRETGTGAARYRLPQVIRQYATEHLVAAGESEALVERQMRQTLETVAGLLGQLRGVEQVQALGAIELRLGDVRAAWRHAARTGAATLIARAAPALFHFYDTRSWFGEGEELFGLARRSLATQPTTDAAPALGIVLAREGWFAFHLGRMDTALTTLRQSLDLLRAADASAELIFPLNYLAAVTAYAGDTNQAIRLAQEGLAQARALDDRYGQAIACNILGQIAYDQGDYVGARAWSTRSLVIEEQIGNRWSMAFSLTNLGKAAYAAGALPEARRLLHQSLAIRRELHDTRGMAICLSRLGDTAAVQGETLVAADHYEQSYRLFGEIGNRWGMAAALLLLGQLFLTQKATRPATRLLQEALRHALAAQARPQIVAVMAALGAAAAPDNSWQQALGELAARADLDLTSDEVVRQLALATSASTITISILEALAQAREQIARNVELHAHSVGGSGQDALTARELEVLRLVAEGLSDAQIADRLILSRRTVSTHLSTIYSKLQVNSRTAAVHIARDQGLLQ